MREITRGWAAGLGLALAATGLPATSLADDEQGFYVGGGVGIVEFHDNSVFDADLHDVNLKVVEFLGGYKYNAALGGELRLGTNLASREYTESLEMEGAPQEIRRELTLDSWVSAYYRPELSNEEAKLYGLIGYSQLKRSSDSANLDSNSDIGEASASDSESGLSYGVGVGFVINPDFNFNVEWRRLIDKDDYEVDIATVGIDYRFDFAL